SAGLGVAVLAVNAAGVDISRHVNSVLVALKVGVLLVFVVLAILSPTGSMPASRLPAAGGLFQATALLFFAFTGYARPVTVVEELRDPRRDLPRAVVSALAASTVLYLLVATAALRLLGAAELAASSAPLRDAIATTGFPWAPNLISAGAVVTTATVLLTEFWGLSRLAFAMARHGDLPRGLSAVTSRGVPLRALLVVGAMVIVLSATVDLTPALAASSLSLLLYYAITNATALRLPGEQRLYPRAVSALGAVACLVLTASLPLSSLLVVGTVLGVGLLLFLLRQRG
ncbi:MAG: amino acid permease, partial [Anaerolineae bacterium]|nr:amino acid permease [Anaerolineae bacterium]